MKVSIPTLTPVQAPVKIKISMSYAAVEESLSEDVFTDRIQDITSLVQNDVPEEVKKEITARFPAADLELIYMCDLTPKMIVREIKAKLHASSENQIDDFHTTGPAQELIYQRGDGMYSIVTAAPKTHSKLSVVAIFYEKT